MGARSRLVYLEGKKRKSTCLAPSPGRPYSEPRGRIVEKQGVFDEEFLNLGATDGELERLHGRPRYANAGISRLQGAKQVPPDFIGSLQHHVYYRDQYGPDRIRYRGWPASVDQNNLAVQILLWTTARSLGSIGCELPFSFPTIPQEDMDCIELGGSPTTRPSSDRGRAQQGGQP